MNTKTFNWWLLVTTYSALSIGRRTKVNRTVASDAGSVRRISSSLVLSLTSRRMPSTRQWISGSVTISSYAEGAVAYRKV